MPSGPKGDLGRNGEQQVRRISDIKTMMRKNAATIRENISNVVALWDIVDDTSTQMKTMTEALREVTETANNAFCLASGAQPVATYTNICPMEIRW